MPTSIRTLILGFGTSGRIFHAPFLHADPHFEISGVVTSSPERQDRVRAEYPGARIFSSLSDALEAQEGFDLAVVASPNSLHESHARQLLNANMHVVIDKPFALSAAGARTLVDQAREAGKLLTVFQNRRWDADFVTLSRLLEQGSLGEVRRFESRFEWWKPQQESSWKTDSSRESGGGILYDLGSHLIDQALHLFGPVLSVHTEIDQRRAGVSAEDDVFLALHHENGVRSHLWMNAVAPGRGPRFHVTGSKASYTSWGLDGQEPSLLAGARPGDPEFGTTPPENWGTLSTGDSERRTPTADSSYSEYYRLLAQALLNGAEPPVDPADAIAVLEIIESSHASTRHI